MKVCHLTSVHHRRDTRIFLKELPTLVKAGHEVTVIVADGKGAEEFMGYKIIDVGIAKNRIVRMIMLTKKIFKKALDQCADIYHFHDPELIPAGIKLIKRGKKVVYDVHEDVPRDLQSKYYLPSWFRNAIARIFEKYEDRSAAKLSFIITATPFILKRFRKINTQSEVINNYPKLNELTVADRNIQKENAVCYIGDITLIRAAKEILDAVGKTGGMLHLAGNFETENLEKELKGHPFWQKVIFHGFVNRVQAADIMAKSIAGLVIFYPEPNHINAQPNKIFEYMSAGLPVIGSDFPLWKDIIMGNNCGFCVDPMDPGSIASAIDYCLTHPDEAGRMGENGMKAVREKYAWETEEKKLEEIYLSLEKC